MYYVFIFYIVIIFVMLFMVFFFFFKQKTAYELRISDWSSDVCSSDLALSHPPVHAATKLAGLSSAGNPACRGAHSGNRSWLGPRRAEIGRASCRERVCKYV